MERQATMVKDMTEGKVVPLLLRFAFPLFVSNALQAVYNVVDMVVVGNYIGKAGMSAVSIGGDLLHLLTFVAMGFCSAGQVIIARAVGERRPEDIRKTIGTMFTFLLSVSAAIAVICYLLRASLLSWLTTPAVARAVSSSPAVRVLVPMNRTQCENYVVGVRDDPLSVLLDEAADAVIRFLGEQKP